MNELKTLQEAGDKEFIERYSMHLKQEEKYPLIDDFVLNSILGFIQQGRQKSFTLGIQKGIELVEGVVPDKREIIEWSTRPYTNEGFNECRSEILSNITRIKQELK